MILILLNAYYCIFKLLINQGKEQSNKLDKNTLFSKLHFNYCFNLKVNLNILKLVDKDNITF